MAKFKTRRADKGTKKQVPTLQELNKMTQLDVHNLTSATQRKLLVSLNRMANQRLIDIGNAINQGKLTDSVISERRDLFYRLVQEDGTEFTLKNKFTASRNLTKSQMEEQIFNRRMFLNSKITSVEGYLKTQTIRRQQLVDQFNKAMGYLKGMDGYKEQFTERQYQQWGKLLNRMRAAKILKSNEDPKYSKWMERAAQLLEEHPRMGVDSWFKIIEKEFNEELEIENAKREAEAKAREQARNLRKKR